MKEAYWALGIIVAGLFGLLLINLFGDITVTNQQDYTIMKNSVEGAMNDAIDEAAYKRGFCLCTFKQPDANGVYTFESKDEYTVNDLEEGQNDCSSFSEAEYGTCELKVGEVKLNSEVFVENFIRRFSENVQGSKDYKIFVNEIIEYPPKVSVAVKSANSTNVLKDTFSDSDFDIVNNIDSILEYEPTVCEDKYETGALTCNSSNCVAYDKNGNETLKANDTYKTVTTVEFGSSKCTQFSIKQIVEKTSTAGTFKVSYQAKKNENCSGGGNVVLVLDASGSIDTAYSYVKKQAGIFFDNLLDANCNVGLVVFNSSVKASYRVAYRKITKYPDVSGTSKVGLGMQEAIYQLGYYDNGAAATAKGTFFEKRTEDFSTGSNYIILLGDGLYTGSDWNTNGCRDEMTCTTNLLKHDNLKVFSIGFGSSVNESKLRAIAGCSISLNTTCDEYYEYSKAKNGNLDRIFEAISGKIAVSSLTFTDTISSVFTSSRSSNTFTVDLMQDDAVSIINNTTYTIKLKDSTLKNSSNYVGDLSIKSSNSEVTVKNNPIVYKGCE